MITKYGTTVSVTKFSGDKDSSFKIEKVYKDKQTNEYKPTTSFYIDDIRTLYFLLGRILSEEVKTREFEGKETKKEVNNDIDDELPF